MAKAAYGSRKKFHYLYRTTCLVNGRYYLGMHSTDNLKDGYMGSGTYLRRSLNKHGKENHKIEILEFFDSREALVEAEKSLISEQDIKSKDCMNLKKGGIGGFTREESDTARELATQKRVWLLRNDPRWKEAYLNSLSKGQRKRVDRPLKEWVQENGPWWEGRKHSEKSKQKMSKSHKDRLQDPTSNSQYGTMWITDEIKNKKIKKGEQIPDGWRPGRVLKKE